MKKILAFILCVSGGPLQAEPERPIYVYLYARVFDHINLEHSEERIRRTLATLKEQSDKHPEAKISATFLFSGTVADALEQRKANGMLRRILDAKESGLIEIGYDGSEEPVYHRRIGTPHAVKVAKTAEERWLARAKVAEAFMTEYKDPLTGEPDARRSGGLQRVQEVFGEAALVTGLSEEMGSQSDVLNVLRKNNRVGNLFGIPVRDLSNKLSGYGGAIQIFGDLVSPRADCSPQLFWQDGRLRISQTTTHALRPLRSYEGREAAEKLIAGLDRKRPQVVMVILGHEKMYLRDQFDYNFMNQPTWYAYFHPEDPALPAAVFKEGAELDESFENEKEILGWLAEEALPAGPGSRFISNADLRRIAETRSGDEVSIEELRAASRDLLSEWNKHPMHPPNFASAGDSYFSLADMFLLLAGAANEKHENGAWPKSITLTEVFGPVDMTDATGAPNGAASIAEVIEAAAALWVGLRDQSWAPIPRNAVPGWIQLSDAKVNSAQFLKLMAEALLADSDDARLKIEPSLMHAPIALTLPTLRDLSDRSGVWTIKPACLGM